MKPLIIVFFVLLAVQVCSAIEVYHIDIDSNKTEEVIIKNNADKKTEYCIITSKKECFWLQQGEERRLIINAKDNEIIIEEHLEDIVNSVAIKTNKKQRKRLLPLAALICFVPAFYFITKRLK